MSSGRAILLIILAAPCIIHALQCKCTTGYNDNGGTMITPCRQGTCTVSESLCTQSDSPNRPAYLLPSMAVCTKSYDASANKGEAGYGCACLRTEATCERTGGQTTCSCTTDNCNGAAKNVVGFGIMVTLVAVLKLGFF